MGGSLVIMFTLITWKRFLLKHVSFLVLEIVGKAMSDL